MVVETPCKRPSSRALSTRSAPRISSCRALVASGIRTARKTLASRQTRGGRSALGIVPALFKLLMDLLEIGRRQLLSRQPEGVGQAWWDKLHMKRAIRLWDKDEQIAHLRLQCLTDFAWQGDLVLGGNLGDGRHDFFLTIFYLLDKSNRGRGLSPCQETLLSSRRVMITDHGWTIGRRLSFHVLLPHRIPPT